MFNKTKKRINNMPLENKMRLSYFVIVLPLLLLLIVCIIALNNENIKYESIIDAAGSASRFSLEFKEDFDYETYLVIVESKTFKESELRNMLDSAREVVESLKSEIDSKNVNADRLEDIEKYLRNLGVYTDRIENNLAEGNKYEENIEIWENDVQIVTSLIRESIIQFIYNELQEMQIMREEMVRLYHRILSVIMISTVVVAMVVVAMSYRISRSITSPITHLSQITESVSRGDLSVRAKVETGAELGVFADSLNVMIERINKLLEQIKQEQIHLRKTELELLQLQINPHFLYNTLDTIVWLAEGGDQQKVVEMVGSLSSFFRTTLNEGRDIVTIRDEIKHVRSYLEIQSVRYQDILEYDIDIPEELEKYTIPKITLQPLVENALYHGIKNKRGLGHIKISGEMMSSYLLLYIEDNGIGIDDKRLKQISDKINNTAVDDNEVFGLHNVNERIRLKFGNRYGIHVDSTYGIGTQVSVMLPLEQIDIVH